MLSEHQQYYWKNRDHILAQRRARYKALSHEDKLKLHTVKNQWRKTPKGKLTEKRNTLKRYQHLPTRIKILVYQAKRRAIKFGYEIVDDLYNHLIKNVPEFCECCGIKINYGRPEKNRAAPNSPSLDRLDSSFGYTIENTKLICLNCNRLKSDAGIENIENIFNYMHKHLTLAKRKIKMPYEIIKPEG